MSDRMLNLMPYPQQLEQGRGYFVLTTTLRFSLQGAIDENVQAYVAYALQRLSRQTGLTFSNQAVDQGAQLHFIIENSSKATPQLGDDESYELCITADGIQLQAKQKYGVFRGLETLLQCVTCNENGFILPSLTIKDAPRFGWRGVSYDCARRYIELPVILRQLEAMASAKLNVFHWHFWDDQAIRLAFEQDPALWQATSDGWYYTKAQVKTVIAHATALGIRVIPEISLPGHASAVACAYPHLMSDPHQTAYSQQKAWGVFTPLMDPTNPQLYALIERVLDEIIALFPDEYLHIGGDEPNYQQWKNNPKIQEFIKQHQLDGERGLQSYLNQKVEKLLAQRGKKMIGWDEIWHQDLPKSIVIQSWQGQESLARAARQGYQGILSTGFYLDQAQPTSYHYLNDPLPHLSPLDDQLQKGESFEYYAWQKPCVKGAPHQGHLLIIHQTDGQCRAFIDYQGKARQALTVLSYQTGHSFRGYYSNFMSYTECHYEFEQNQLAASSYQRIGNVRCPVTGERVAQGSEQQGDRTPAPEGGYLTLLDQSEQAFILGGEMTVWGEQLDSMLIEKALWPRSYAIAERLWSSAQLTCLDSMYRRMQAVEAWAELSVGLHYRAKAQLILQRLCPAQEISPLKVLANYIEPGQYYARHWDKWRMGAYHQQERLNRFVDALAMESTTVYRMQHLATCYQQGRLSALAELAYHYQQLQDSAAQAQTLFAHSPLASSSLPVAQTALAVAELGLALVRIASQKQRISFAQYEDYHTQLEQHWQLVDECIVAAVFPTQQLLNALVEGFKPTQGISV